MQEFWELNKGTIIYALCVVGIVCILRIATYYLYKFIERKSALKYQGEDIAPIHLIKRILNALWIVLGIMALAFIVIDEESYKRAQKNFEIVFYLGMVAVITLVVASLVRMWFKRAIAKKTALNDDTTSYRFLRYLAVFAVYFVGILLAILAFPSLRGIAQTALGGAGLIAVVAGVASQEALANLVGGLFIIFFKPFRTGDVIKITDTMVGTVTDITLRHTVLRNYENKMIVIPNAIINKEKLVNYDLGDRRCCEWIEIGISYDSDVDLAKHIMREECEQHPNLIDNRSELDLHNEVPKVLVRVTGLGESSVDLRAWAWAMNFPEAFVMRCELLESIKKRFDKEGIEIPFPHRTMVFKKEQLQAIVDDLKKEKAVENDEKEG
ncbi:mechanosensitive ion channel family protein [Flavimarina sp. Hel_I_48]|uniref:mechanosensitive ion channel family protein n=1 Tax=Flavimarina sp. Hel_I_48 TaxID=1392488 RepID=UPI0004DFAC36|nr:mechanosensitive ion channel family protein [Flavimarina sp. Hel_I_48]